jgi:hypothetical protein
MTSEDQSVSVDELPIEKYSNREDEEILNRVRNRASSSGRRISFTKDPNQEANEEFSPRKIYKKSEFGVQGIEGMNYDSSIEDSDEQRIFRSFSTGERLAVGILPKTKISFELDMDSEIFKGVDSTIFKKNPSEQSKVEK